MLVLSTSLVYTAGVPVAKRGSLLLYYVLHVKCVHKAIPVLKAECPYSFCVCVFADEVFWVWVSFFSSSSTTNLASVLYTCVYTYCMQCVNIMWKYVYTRYV